MKWTKILLLLLVSLIFFMSGCLQVEKKQYIIKLNKDGSGSGEIVYMNLYSEDDEEGKENKQEDFDTLINDYIDGTTFEDENPGLKNVEKKLYEKKGQLWAKVTFEFDKPKAIGLFQYDDDSPWMWFAGSDETFLESKKGEYGDDKMPVIFWDKGAKKFDFTTSVGEYSEKDCRSLVDNWKAWDK